jgi:hypothetical protein
MFEACGPGGAGFMCGAAMKAVIEMHQLPKVSSVKAPEFATRFQIQTKKRGGGTVPSPLFIATY